MSIAMTLSGIDDEMASDENLKRLTATPICDWSVTDCLLWAGNIENFSANVIGCLQRETIDGEVLLTLTEDDIRDFRYRLNYDLKFSELKKFWLSVRSLQEHYAQEQSYTTNYTNSTSITNPITTTTTTATTFKGRGCQTILKKCNTQQLIHRSAAFSPCSAPCTYPNFIDNCLPSGNGAADCGETITPSISVDGQATNIPPEVFKTFISIGYSFLVTWITSFVMVIVHERVPDMKRYPPLPDIFLDNVPHIPWAFHMCELTGTLLFTIWATVCIFHKYRMVLLRRFFALAGTVFLLRCVTMLITSLSVPGTHLQCNQNDYAIDDADLAVTEALVLRISRAYIIWSGLGMSIQGVRTCGDYMFSGHTVALTLLNFFITEYTPRNLYFLHTLTWLLNMFGIFFILAAHEHYSIDVFVAFYITSRLFLYYHTLANNHALMSHDSNRTRIWFPMFSYFESSVDGIIPNEYDSFGTLLQNIFACITSVKDSFMLTARRYWVEQPKLSMTSSKTVLLPNSASKHRNAATSMTNVCNTPTSQTTFHSVFSGGKDDESICKSKSSNSDSLAKGNIKFE